MLRYLSLLTFFFSTVLATGRFLTPTGTDGQTNYTEGNQVQISWTDIDDYDIFSFGYYSTTNATITWLISNSPNHPQTYSWTVDAVEEGFSLQDGHLFRFYACKDTNFSEPFESNLFVINDVSVPSSSTSSSSSSTSSTPTAASTTSSPTPTSSSESSTAPTVSSTGLSTGAKAGIGVGVALGVLGAAALLFFAVRHMRKSSRTHGHESIGGSAPPEYKPPVYGDQSAYGQMQEQTGFDKPWNGAVQQAPGNSDMAPPVAELGTPTAPSAVRRAELPS